MTLLELFNSLGYTKDDFLIIMRDSYLKKLPDNLLYENVLRNYQFLIECGYSQKDIINITKGNPSIYALPVDGLKTKIDNFILLGYAKKDIIKMSLIRPTIYKYSCDDVQAKLFELMKLGYSQKDIVKMTKNQPVLYGLSMINLRRKMNFLIKLGYTHEEIILMTSKYPSIYCLSFDSIKQKIEDMISLGYTRSDVIKMSKKVPTILGLSIENLRDKIEFYDSVDMHNLPNIYPASLMQSVELTYARYCFFKDNNIEINISNYSKLFLGETSMSKMYGITNSNLIDSYQYVKKNNLKTS